MVLHDEFGSPFSQVLGTLAPSGGMRYLCKVMIFEKNHKAAGKGASVPSDITCLFEYD